MAKFFIEYRDQFFRWHQTHTKHNEADAYRTAKAQANLNGRRYRVVDENRRVLDIID